MAEEDEIIKRAIPTLEEIPRMDPDYRKEIGITGKFADDFHMTVHLNNGKTDIVTIPSVGPRVTFIGREAGDKIIYKINGFDEDIYHPEGRIEAILTTLKGDTAAARAAYKADLLAYKEARKDKTRQRETGGAGSVTSLMGENTVHSVIENNNLGDMLDGALVDPAREQISDTLHTSVAEATRKAGLAMNEFVGERFQVKFVDADETTPTPLMPIARKDRVRDCYANNHCSLHK